jgi:uncharacterized RDD family membrane protein YckC
MRWNLPSLSWVTGSAVLSCASVLALVWPTPTHADDPAALVAGQAAVARNTTKIGTLLASSRLVADDVHPGCWLIEVEVRNPGTTPERPEVEAFLSAVDYNPMARIAPMPQVVWSQKQRIQVGAGETAVVRLALPSRLSAAIRKDAAGSSKEDGPKARTQYVAGVKKA